MWWRRPFPAALSISLARWPRQQRQRRRRAWRFQGAGTQAYENIRAALAAAGGGFEHIVKLTQYLIHLRAHQALIREVRAKFFNPELPPPASTMIQVGALTREGALYEVDAVAVLPPR